MTKSVLEELLLVLAGHRSSLFIVTEVAGSSCGEQVPWIWTLRSRSSIHYNHPGERAVLDSLANIAAKYHRILLFAKSVQKQAHQQTLQSIRQRCKSNQWQNKLLVQLTSKIRELLKDYEKWICDLESDILHGSWDIAASENADQISLSSIRARLEEWEMLLCALNQLVSDLLKGPEGAIPTSLKPESITNDSFEPISPPSCPYWGSGQLLDLLAKKAETTVGQVHEFMITLLHTIEDKWVQIFIAWMCYGQKRIDIDTDMVSLEEPIVEKIDQLNSAKASILSASTPFESRLPKFITTENDQQKKVDQNIGWAMIPGAVPKWISDDLALSNTILYVGRALGRVRDHSRRSTSSTGWSSGKMGGVPATLTSSHVRLLQTPEARPCSKPAGFRKAVELVSAELSEWMWRTILKPETIFSTFEALGGYFLHRKGLFITSFLARLTELRKAKLIFARSASTGLIRASDIELALQKASIGTEAEEDVDQLALCEVIVPERVSGLEKDDLSWKTMTDEYWVNPLIRFDNISIGIPFTLLYHTRFPLDMILSPTETRAYSDLFSYLLALQSIKGRLRDCWISLSKSQRARRRFTGTGEGGADRLELRKRSDLLRMACGTAREGMWFLETLDGHFHTDIIDVQFNKFLAQFRVPEKEDMKENDPAPNVSVDKWRHKISQSVHRVSSMGTLREEDESDSRNTTPEPSIPRPARTSYARSVFGGSQFSQKANTVNAMAPNGAIKVEQQPEMDFASARSSHQAFLTYVLQGLLLTDQEASVCIWKILHTCRHFAALIDRWGGDVLPDLLSEGSILGEEKKDALRERIDAIKEVTSILQNHIDRFFLIISEASAKSSYKLPQSNYKSEVDNNGDAKNEKKTSTANDSQSAALRHHEQLLLRLDYNNFISYRSYYSDPKREESMMKTSDE
ncbi:uncharacterized protein FA14DRAFT_52771 [Meira miltonrushii]|uniref:Spindle pole body component n=1 Tax=Meira miltonrushii TaxID=1280837 RepID=A0A316VF91_9BASI|nr:uncharacterized protein FA14DRAFT_52771 [Meira miltonrushii]PWN36200.1 hypothetical protein FA14DRAFT_52771 [Meira miltonrushii]